MEENIKQNYSALHCSNQLVTFFGRLFRRERCIIIRIILLRLVWSFCWSFPLKKITPTTNTTRITQEATNMCNIKIKTFFNSYCLREWKKNIKQNYSALHCSNQLVTFFGRLFRRESCIIIRTILLRLVWSFCWSFPLKKITPTTNTTRITHEATNMCNIKIKTFFNSYCLRKWKKNIKQNYSALHCSNQLVTFFGRLFRRERCIIIRIILLRLVWSFCWSFPLKKITPTTNTTRITHEATNMCNIKIKTFFNSYCLRKWKKNIKQNYSALHCSNQLVTFFGRLFRRESCIIIRHVDLCGLFAGGFP